MCERFVVHRSDPKLIQSALRGEQRAWNEIVDRYARLVYSIPRRYGLPEADAEDVFQQVFIILFRRLETLQDTTKLSSWLITTTHRECWRVGKRSPETAQLIDERVADVSMPDPGEAQRWEHQHLVRQALGRLGGRCEALLRMLFMSASEPSYETIAEELDMKVGSIGPTRARCFKKLEQLLLDMGWESDD
jgi:RNA polymerase sigma factor (sigma-70 family)